MTLLFLVSGLVLLVGGAEALVFGARGLAVRAGISPIVVGLTVVALGTSTPELVVSARAAASGNVEIAVGNLIGSNIFNILLVLGSCAGLSPSGVEVDAHAIEFDLVLMVAVAVACVPIFASNFRVNRWEGVLLFAY